jgi:hypothetical protein
LWGAIDGADMSSGKFWGQVGFSAVGGLIGGFLGGAAGSGAASAVGSSAGAAAGQITGTIVQSAVSYACNVGMAFAGQAMFADEGLTFENWDDVLIDTSVSWAISTGASIVGNEIGGLGEASTEKQEKATKRQNSSSQSNRPTTRSLADAKGEAIRGLKGALPNEFSGNIRGANRMSLRAHLGRDTVGIYYPGSGRINIRTDATGYQDVVPHELCHANTSANWAATQRTHLDEGVTEYFAEKAAFQVSATPELFGGYPAETDIVRSLVDVVGEQKVIDAYFHGNIKGLRDTFNASAGNNRAWGQFVRAMNQENFNLAGGLCDAAKIGAKALFDVSNQNAIDAYANTP